MGALALRWDLWLIGWTPQPPYIGLLRVQVVKHALAHNLEYHKVLNLYLLTKLRSFGDKSHNSLTTEKTLNFCGPCRRVWPATLTNHSMRIWEKISHGFVCIGISLVSNDRETKRQVNWFEWLQERGGIKTYYRWNCIHLHPKFNTYKLIPLFVSRD